MKLTAQLTWEVFVSPLEFTVVDGPSGGPALPGFEDLPPGVQYETWSPISSTLITGQRDAVLVDPLMTTTQARVLAGWIAATGKNLCTIYVTHGHGDHHFGLSVILDRFPGARAVAAPAVVERMREAVDPDAVASFWAELLPGQTPERLVVAEPLKEGGFDLEGHDPMVMELGHTDTDTTTCLHVPDIGLVVAGDAVYNDVHLYLAESDPDRRKAWISAIDRIEALEPQVRDFRPQTRRPCRRSADPGRDSPVHPRFRPYRCRHHNRTRVVRPDARHPFRPREPRRAVDLGAGSQAMTRPPTTASQLNAPSQFISPKVIPCTKSQQRTSSVSAGGNFHDRVKAAMKAIGLTEFGGPEVLKIVDPT
jgi:glyoxylase-like metal-dependent hydrolase (beta-lactamase superfamily II)